MQQEVEHVAQGYLGVCSLEIKFIVRWLYHIYKPSVGKDDPLTTMALATYKNTSTVIEVSTKLKSHRGGI